MVHGKTKGRKLAFLDCRRFNLYPDDALQGTGNHLLAVSSFHNNGGNGLSKVEKNIIIYSLDVFLGLLKKTGEFIVFFVIEIIRGQCYLFLSIF